MHLERNFRNLSHVQGTVQLLIWIRITPQAAFGTKGWKFNVSYTVGRRNVISRNRPLINFRCGWAQIVPFNPRRPCARDGLISCI